MPHARVLACTVAVLLITTLHAAAQMELGAMQGTVKDDEGRPLADVAVKLKDLTRGRVIERT